MARRKRGSLLLGMVSLTMIGLFIVSLACASTEPTPTPVSPVAPAQPVAPVAAPQPTVALIPGAPTPIPAKATPTRVLPTATPVAMAKPASGGLLRYGIGGAAFSTLDPHHSIDPDEYRAMYQIFSQIVELGSDGALEPELAKSWDITADGKTITFQFESGVKFHDGTDFNAQAVKWNFDRMLDPDEISPRRGEFAGIISSISTPNSNTLVFQLTKAFRPFVALLADRPGFIVSPTGVQTLGQDFGAKPVGAGPFILSEWNPGVRVVLKKNENYWEDGLPYLDEIRMPIIHDSIVKVAMLRTNELEMMPGTAIRAEEVPILRRNSSLKVFEFQGAGTVMMHFNVNKEPYTNRALRQAIAFAIDRDTFVDVQFQGQAVPAYNLIAAGWAFRSEARSQDFDLNMVKTKLAEAGYTGEKLRFGCRTTTFYLQQCELAHVMINEAGINMELELMEPGSYNIPDRGYMGTQGLGLVYWFHRADPHTLNFWLYHKDGFSALRTGYNNPQLNPLIEEAATVYDFAAAAKAYDKIQQIAGEDVQFLYIVYPSVFEVMNKKVNGFIRRPDNWGRLKTVWLAQ